MGGTDRTADPLKILIVSGIWPPDIGGPASHGPELGAFLLARGHSVRAVASTENGRPEASGFPVRGVGREEPRPLRIARGFAAAAAAAGAVDVVYATGGMYTRSAAAATLRSRPLVMKLVNDPAYERARHLGFFKGSIDDFQQAGGARVRALKAMRDASLRRATRIVTPGHYLARMAIGWGLPEQRFEVIPNPAAHSDQSTPREELRRRFGMAGPTFVFAGRFVKQKNIPLAVRALAHAPEARLVLVGGGDEEAAVHEAIEQAGVADRVTVIPPRPRSEAMQWVRAGDAAILPSDWEGFPHAAVEALSVGTPVVATAVGAVPEIVEPDTNGLLVPAGDEGRLGAAMDSLARDPQRLARLREGAANTGDRYAPERTFGAIEQQLRRAVLGDATAS